MSLRPAIVAVHNLWVVPVGKRDVLTSCDRFVERNRRRRGTCCPRAAGKRPIPASGQLKSTPRLAPEFSRTLIGRDGGI